MADTYTGDCNECKTEDVDCIQGVCSSCAAGDYWCESLHNCGNQLSKKQKDEYGECFTCLELNNH